MHQATTTPRIIRGALLAAGVLLGSLIGCQALSGSAGGPVGTVTTPMAPETQPDRAVGGNDVFLLRDATDAEQAVLSAIAGARDHIHLDTFAFDDGAAGHRLARALMARQSRGVSVHVLLDAVGTPSPFFERLTAAGVQLHTSRATEGGARYHRRLLIVDGHTAFIGGIPQDRPHPDQVGTGRDTDLRLQGPVVAELQRLFMERWNAQAGPSLPARTHFPAPVVAGSQVVRAIVSHPGDHPHPAKALLITAIDNARRSIHLTNARFMADADVLEALEAAARRGVAVHLVVPGHGDSWLLLQAGRAHYARLLRAGVRLHERSGTIRHARTVLVDGGWALLGSSNLDWGDASAHHELHTVVSGKDFAASLQTLFDLDIASSVEIDPQHWNARTTDQRMREVFGRAWAWWY